MENKDILEKEVFIAYLENPINRETDNRNILVEGESIDDAIKTVSKWLTHTGSKLVLSSVTRIKHPLIRREDK